MNFMIARDYISLYKILNNYFAPFAELRIQRKLKIISVLLDHTVKLLLLCMLHMLSLSCHKVMHHVFK